MIFRSLVIALALLAVIASDSWAQSKQPSPQSKPPATDQRGTDQIPLSVKILPATDAKEQADKTERDRKEKAIIDEKLAFETQRIADYTDWLAVFTGLLFLIAILQAALFFWQLRYMRDEGKRARAAFISANRPKSECAGFDSAMTKTPMLQQSSIAVLPAPPSKQLKVLSILETQIPSFLTTSMSTKGKWK
jgi:hypothetical protein